MKTLSLLSMLLFMAAASVEALPAHKVMNLEATTQLAPQKMKVGPGILQKHVAGMKFQSPFADKKVLDQNGPVESEPIEEVQPIRYASGQYRIYKQIIEVAQDGTVTASLPEIQCAISASFPVFDVRDKRSYAVRWPNFSCEVELYEQRTTVFSSGGIIISNHSGPSVKGFGGFLSYMEPRNSNGDGTALWDGSFVTTQTLNLRDLAFELSPNKNAMMGGEPRRVEMLFSGLKLDDDAQ